MWNALLDLVYPPELNPEVCHRIEFPFCDLCGEPVAGEVNASYQCSNCIGRKWYIRRARAAYCADGDVLEWIHQCKYRSHWHRLPQLSRWLEEGYEKHYAQEPPDGLVPVPLHWRRFLSRGFNQAGELSRALSRRTQIPVFDVMRRRKHTRVQASLSRKERMENCRSAFTMKKRAFDVRGKRLLLIDDVFTTGSTVNACARQLKQHGAQSVSVLTVARGGNF